MKDLPTVPYALTVSRRNLLSVAEKGRYWTRSCLPLKRTRTARNYLALVPRVTYSYSGQMGAMDSYTLQYRVRVAGQGTCVSLLTDGMPLTSLHIGAGYLPSLDSDAEPGEHPGDHPVSKRSH